MQILLPLLAQADAALNMASDAVGNADIEDAPPLPTDAGGAVGNVAVGMLTSYEFWLSVILLLFGLSVIAIQLYVSMRRNADGDRHVSVETVIRLTMVSLIIVGAMVLIAAGYSSDQIGPAMGLFGTIAGYLIGKQDRPSGS